MLLSPMGKKKWAVFFVVVGLTATQCKPSKQAPACAESPLIEFDLAAIQKRGYLNALVDNNSVSYFIYRGTPMGYEYELLQYFAKQLKVKLKIKVISGVEEAIDQLSKGEGDVLAFPLTITKERTQYLSFS
ncbi:MAG: transporter substrate-binding domain-containing protein, partial [Flammeovirgaceae bacterium]